MNKPEWLTIAESYIGEKEIKGSKHNPVIVDFWKKIKLNSISNDEIPWCASFVGAVLEESKFISSRSGLAKSYLNWGTKLNYPCLGCIVVFTRQGGGHVGFVEGVSENGSLYVLGGNQSDSVCIKSFSTKNVVGYRWPKTNVLAERAPILNDEIIYETKVT